MRTRRRIENGEWRMENEEWKMGIGEVDVVVVVRRKGKVLLMGKARCKQAAKPYVPGCFGRSKVDLSYLVT